MVSCGQVREWYVVSYEEIRDFPRPVTVEEEIKFAELLKVKDSRGRRRFLVTRYLLGVVFGCAVERTTFLCVCACMCAYVCVCV